MAETIRNGIDAFNKKPGYAFAFVLLLSFSLSVLLYNPFPLILPAGILLLFFAVAKPKKAYGLFFFLLPFSIEFELPGGFGTDLPSEPLMLFFSLIALILLISSAGGKKTGFLKHPISLVLFLHIAWILLSSLGSTNAVFSLKFLAAKIWYVLPFYVLPLLLLEGEKDYRFLFKCFALGLTIAVSYVMLRHAAEGFSFKSINDAVKPIFRNHVNYGIMLVIALPFYIYLLYSNKDSFRFFKILGVAFLLLAIYLTYTRAAQLSVIIALGSYLIIRLRLTKLALISAAVFLIAGFAYLSYNNTYLDMAPEYSKAIEHKKFDNLVEATTKMEDISTVERFYRWIAGFNMVAEKPLTGFGPATFYSEYRPYTITSYKTYVSDNPEKSGIHNYYLMTAVEQGVPGLIIFLFMCVLVLMYAEKVYHSSPEPASRMLVMASGVALIIMLAVLLINDLLEADKVGPFFFICMAIIVSADKGRLGNKTIA